MPVSRPAPARFCHCNRITLPKAFPEPALMWGERLDIWLIELKATNNSGNFSTLDISLLFGVFNHLALSVLLIPTPGRGYIATDMPSFGLLRS